MPFDAITGDLFGTPSELTSPAVAKPTNPKRTKTAAISQAEPEEASYSSIIQDLDLYAHDPIPCCRILLGKLVSGLKVFLPYELAFQAFPHKEVLDVSQRWLDTPKTIETPMVCSATIRMAG